jgi:hypothetical protein
MTGGFYDYKRSKLKLLSVIRENNKLVNAKQQELTKVRADLQNILQTSFSSSSLLVWMFSCLCLVSYFSRCSITPEFYLFHVY